MIKRDTEKFKWELFDTIQTTYEESDDVRSRGIFLDNLDKDIKGISEQTFQNIRGRVLRNWIMPTFHLLNDLGSYCRGNLNYP